MSPLAKVFTLMLCLGWYVSLSQSSSDSLDLARNLRNKGETEKSVLILERYTASHPEDFNGYWLLGETLYWTKNFGQARQAYREAVKLAPDNLYLKLDFARVLLNTRKYRESKTLLAQLTEYEETRDAALLELTRLHYWTARMARAKQTLKQIRSAVPGSEELRDEIALAGALALNASGAYSSDTQPLDVITAVATASIALSPFLSPSVDVVSSTFLSGVDELRHGRSFGASNRFALPATGSALTVHGGYFFLPEGNQKVSTYRLTFDQKIARSVSARLATDRKPYLSTLASLHQPLMVNGLQVYIEFGNENTFNGRAGYEETKFEDDNRVSSFYAYLLSRGFGSAKTKVALGYAYAFNDAQADRFVTEDPSRWNADGTLAGVYDPYFTPSQQMIHSGLVNLRLRFSKHFMIGANTSIALFAATMNPYFYLEQRGNATRLIKDFVKVRYTPYEINAFGTINLSSNAFIRVDYNFSSTFFYQRNIVKLTIGGFLR